MKNNKYINWFMSAVVAVTGFTMTACEDEPDKYEIADGIPTINYVRMADFAASDSLITGAYMSNTICLVGNNLRSITELYFNDQKAILNTSYMTDHTVIVDVPKNIPEVVTDKIYMVNSKKDTIDYDFKVLVPQPEVLSMNCEFLKPGETAVIYGDYFIDDPNVPLAITFPGNVAVTEITEITKTAVTFTVPEGAMGGYINVTSIYGTGRSKFYYNDTRNILFDWDGSHGGFEIGLGWRDGSKVKKTDEYGFDGSYIQFEGEMAGGAGATWGEDPFSFNYWPDPANGYPALSSLPAFADMIATYGVSGLQMKFEVCIPSSNPWQSAALQIIFSGDNSVTYATGNNTYFSDASVPRALWMPWQSTGSYDTGGEWRTVSVSLADHNKTFDGNACGTAFDETMLTGLTFFVWNGGVEGTDCNPIIRIDNIRVVPIE